MMLEIQKLTAKTAGITILKDLDFSIQKGEIHAIMGPNGAGKSTLAKVLAGHPSYEVSAGSIRFKGQNLLEREPEERAHDGLFMSFQYPVEIPGVSNEQFLKAALNSHRKAKGLEPISDQQFQTLLDEKMSLLGISKDFKKRNLNEGFSGGEKKRNEILQLAMLSPDLAILDETDSGLDIDALRNVAEGIKAIHTNEMSLLLITHYQRLLEYVKPDVVHVMVNGHIVRTGSPDLALELEEKGYNWLTLENEDCRVSP